jgi:NADH-quinone oxidoreductase subunit D
VRRDLTAAHVAKIREALPILEERTRYYLNLATGETTFLARAKGVGILTKEDAIRLGAVGPNARASGVDRDVRRDDPYAAYAEIPFEVITADSCDILGRTAVRVFELFECYKMIRYILDNLPEGDIRTKVMRKIPAGEAVSRYEAPRGEDIHYVASNGTDKPERVKVRAPTLANWPSIAHILVGHYIADIPLVLAAIDPCFSCTDRAIRMTSRDTGERQTMDWEDLRRYSIEWYHHRGVDFRTVRLGV